MITFEELPKKLSSLAIVALTIYGEARGEPIEGIVAVANVIKNRVRSSERFSQFKDYESVCLSPKQFSCWNENDANLPELLEIADQVAIVGHMLPKQNVLWDEINYVVAGILIDKLLDNTFGALYYMTADLAKKKDQSLWKKKTVKGSQIFYSL